MVFVEGPINEIKLTHRKGFSVLIMKVNAMTMNFEPHKCVLFAQTTKICTHENKAIHGMLDGSICISTSNMYLKEGRKIKVCL